MEAGAAKQLMGKTFLVTGGAGFIGSHLTDALLARGDRVVVVDNLESGKIDNLPVGNPSLHFVQADVRELDAIASEIPSIDGVIHLAALISGYDSLSAPDDYWDVNVTGLLRVIDFVRDRNVGRVVLASSSTVYGNQESVALSEETPPKPLTVYALTKLAGEHLLRMYAPLCGYTHCSLRLFNVYGPRQSPDHPYANVTCKFSHAAANGLPVNLYGDGEQSRDFVYVGDVVRAFLAVLDRSDREIYNVGTGNTARIRELITLLNGIGDRPLRVDQQPEWPNDIRSIRADTRRFQDEFGFMAEVPLADGLGQTVDFFRQQDAAQEG
jgi:UDP-glucose 4-epimerase